MDIDKIIKNKNGGMSSTRNTPSNGSVVDIEDKYRKVENRKKAV